jgi:bifunctional UDP-N-acetylglucosamine pyrophosphorylase/glucosamine-1-phosphate N-acetyltransferase
MLDYLADLYSPFVDRVAVIAHPSFASDVERWARGRERVSVAEQPSPTGMLDAVLVASQAVRRFAPDFVWITWGDQIGVLPSTLRNLAAAMEVTPPPALALPTVMIANPYTHFDRDASGRIVRLRQRREGDAMPPEGESDMGVFAMTRETYQADLHTYAVEVPAGSVTGERNFVPFVAWLAARKPVATCPCTDPREAIGINTPAELDSIAAWLRERA